GIGRGGPAAAPDTLVLLVQDRLGYASLSKLVSKAFLESDAGEAPQIDLEALEGMSDGLIALTGGLSGAIGRLASEGQGEAAEALLLRLKALFPGRLYIELMRHALPAEDRI